MASFGFINPDYRVVRMAFPKLTRINEGLLHIKQLMSQLDCILKVKQSLSLAMEAHRVVRRRGSHIF
jgi:hypothetical protein